MSSSSSSFSVRDLSLGWLTSGLANAITSSVLNPFDVIKTRMQVLQVTAHTPPSFRLVFRQILKEGKVRGYIHAVWLLLCLQPFTRR
jgi:hypothetical protein